MPKGVIGKLNSIIAGFIWSSRLDVRKRHWVAWSKVTLPKHEGGLGVRKFEELQVAFSVKQDWGLLKGTSLWSQVFSTKFLKGNHLLRSVIGGKSKCFKALVPFFEHVVMQSKMLVGRGDQADFLCDHWLEGGPLICRVEMRPSFFPKVSEVFVGSQW